MASIPEQRCPALAPLFQGRVVKKTPAVAGVGIYLFDQLRNISMPITEGSNEFRSIAAFGP